jgi:hypothetical protein
MTCLVVSTLTHDDLTICETLGSHTPTTYGMNKISHSFKGIVCPTRTLCFSTCSGEDWLKISVAVPNLAYVMLKHGIKISPRFLNPLLSLILQFIRLSLLLSPYLSAFLSASTILGTPNTFFEKKYPPFNSFHSLHND